MGNSRAKRADRIQRDNCVQRPWGKSSWFNKNFELAVLPCKKTPLKLFMKNVVASSIEHLKFERCGVDLFAAVFLASSPILNCTIPGSSLCLFYKQNFGQWITKTSKLLMFKTWQKAWFGNQIINNSTITFSSLLILRKRKLDLREVRYLFTRLSSYRIAATNWNIG